MSNILFIDNTTPKAYDYNDLEYNAMGGTEATLLRVAKGLAKEHGIYVLQHNRGEAVSQQDVEFITMESMFPPPDVVIHLRVTAHVPVYKAIFPKARHYAWMHDLCGEYYKNEIDELESLDGIIYVSEYHKRQFEQMLKGFKFDIKLPIGHVIYNIVDATEGTSIEAYNSNRLLFASSPHKGLQEVLSKFSLLRQKRPNLELGVLNPGYIELENIEEKDGVKVYGVRNHKDFISILKRSAMLFYPQTSFPETFGLVLAEANAVYTPVVAHNFGAAREVLTDPFQAFDCTNTAKVVERTLSTLDNYNAEKAIEQLGPNPAFTTESVIQEWKLFLRGEAYEANQDR